MKNLILFVICFFLPISISFGVVRTVSNDPSGGSQYVTLQDAYNASHATNGDTILLEGTNIDYSMSLGVAWEKKITVIGIGFNPQKQNARLTRISFATTVCCWTTDRFELKTGASGSKFYGIYFVAVGYNILYTQPVSNLVFEDCRFSNLVYMNNYTTSNIIFRNCVFDSFNGTNVFLGGSAPMTNINFTSCVFSGYIDGGSNPLQTMFIDNCLFLSTTQNAFLGVRYSTISDCIFMNRFPAGTTDCTFLNNISGAAGTYPPAGTGNIGSNNIAGANPNFVTYTANQSYSTTHNYNLQAGSPAIGTGTTGSDMGPHGSGSGFSRYGEVLTNPIIRQVIITNPSVSPNGTLNVDINATKPNDN